MKITEVEIRNVCRIEYVKINPNGTSTFIGGKNRQGKTTLLDCICYALGGKKLCPAKPIKNGEDFGEIRLSLDGDEALPQCTVIRRFFRKGEDDYESNLEILDTEGNPSPEPQTILNGLLRRSSFDPVAFMRLPPLEQANMLKELVGLDFSKLDKEYDQVFEARKGNNKKARDLDGEIARMKFHDGMPEQAPDINALLEKAKQQRADLEARNKQEATVAQCGKLLEQYKASLAEEEGNDVELYITGMKQLRDEQHSALMKELKSRHERELEELNARHAREAAALAASQEVAFKECEQSCEEHRKNHQDKLADLTARIEKGLKITAEETAKLEAMAVPNVEETDEEIRQQSKITEKIADNKRWKKTVDDLKAVKAAIEVQEKRLAAIKAEKKQQMESAKWPIDGLGFDADGGVTYNDLPIQQTSQAEGIDISVAIGAALNPRLKFALVREGSSLDDESLAELALKCDKYDVQLFLERVGEGSECHIIMRDGKVKEQHADSTTA